MANVDHELFETEIGNAMADLRLEFDSRLKELRLVVDDANPTDWIDINRQIYVNEIGDITFGNYDGAYDLLKNIHFDPIPQQQLLEYDSIQLRTHVFESVSLDTAENKIVDVLAAAGDGEMKDLNGVLIPQATRDALMAGQEANDQFENNEHRRLQNLYPSADTPANNDWHDYRYRLKREDREKSVFSELFNMAQENIQWGYTNGIKIEDMHADFTIRYCSLIYNITAANIAAYKAEVMANIAEFEAKIREVETHIEVERLKFTRDSAKWGLEIQQANQRIGSYVQYYAGQMGSNLKKLDARIIGGNHVSDGYKSIFTSTGSRMAAITYKKTDAE